jgi:hypothetical protein
LHDAPPRDPAQATLINFLVALLADHPWRSSSDLEETGVALDRAGEAHCDARARDPAVHRGVDANSINRG